MNPFGSLFGTPRYNSQSIPSVSNPLSFGIPNMMSQFSSSIPTTNEILVLDLGAWLLSRLVEVIFPKQILWLEVGLLFLLGLILVSMLLDGLPNRAEKLLPIFHPLPLLPPCGFRQTHLVWRIPLFPTEFHMEGVIFTLWETPSPELLHWG
jgi:hypothetical protein